MPSEKFPLRLDPYPHHLAIATRYDGVTYKDLGQTKSPAPEQLLVVTKQFGTFASYLHPEFTKETSPQEKPDFLPLPDQITQLCQLLRGLGGSALLVGGCVRDALFNQQNPELKITPKDFDLEIYGLALPDLHRIVIEQYGEKNLNTVGKAFGIIKLTLLGLAEPIDLSIPRRDSKVGTGHTGFRVEGDPGMTIREGARRRDLRINSLAYDPSTKILFDPFGAEYDLQLKQIEVTDPEKFIEDPLRVMRIMQFVARFELTPTPATIELCRHLIKSGELDTLPVERITEEFKKMLLKGKKPSLGLDFARQVGLVEHFWPELQALIGVPQNPDWHPEGDVWLHTLQTVDAAQLIAKREHLAEEKHLALLLTMIGHDFGKATKTVFERGAWRAPGHEEASLAPTKTFLARFQFGDEVVHEVLALVPEHMSPKAYWLQQFPEDDRKPVDMSRALRRLAHRLYVGGKSSLEMLALVAEADQRGRNGQANVPLTVAETDGLTEWQTWFLSTAEKLQVAEKPPQALLTGQLLMEHFRLKKGGPGVGVLLKLVFLDQLDGKISDVAEALERADFYLKQWGLSEQLPSEPLTVTPALLTHPGWNQWYKMEDGREKLS